MPQHGGEPLVAPADADRDLVVAVLVRDAVERQPLRLGTADGPRYDVDRRLEFGSVLEAAVELLEIGRPIVFGQFSAVSSTACNVHSQATSRGRYRVVEVG